MAGTKKYIIKQTTNWNGRGEKVGTSTVVMDEADIPQYLALLDGKLEVFEQNLTLSADVATATASFNVVDFIALKHAMAKTIYISNANKRPIVLKTGQDVEKLRQVLTSVKPFPAPYASDIAKDVSIDTGNISLL